MGDLENETQRAPRRINPAARAGDGDSPVATASDVASPLVGDTPGSTSSTTPAGGDLPPMTPSLMGQLFGVPAVIVSAIVGCAVVVVLLFGSITTQRERSVSSLLDVLEGRIGEKTAGVLLPNEQEVWQVSRELAMRLVNKDVELTADELQTVVKRLSSLLTDYADSSSDLSEMGRKQLHFVMRALCRTDDPNAIRPIARMLDDPSASTRREALSALAALGRLPQARAALPRMIEALADHDSVVRTTACVSISAIVKEPDAEVIAALGRAYFDADREVRWNAALALARLGSPKGKSLLLDMLDRDYWENDVKVRVETSSGDSGAYPLPASAAARYLVAAIEAASHLQDPEIWDQIRKLDRDPAPSVADAARKVLRLRGTLMPGASEGI